jgi:hypothetical protein
VLVTNAVQGLRPVHSVDGTVIGTGGPDGMFAELHHLYERDRGAMVGAVR